MGYQLINSNLMADKYEVVYKVMDINDPKFAIDFEEVSDELELEKWGFVSPMTICLFRLP